MASNKIKKEGNYDYTITDKAKDTVYEFLNADIAYNSSLDFINTADSVSYAKKDDDLSIIFAFGVKNVIISVKDYYKYAPTYNNIVYNNSTTVYPDASADDIPYFAVGTYTDTPEGGYVYGNKSATKYNIHNTLTNSLTVKDFGGNDNYDIKAHYDNYNKNTIYIDDYSGSDKYTLTDSSDSFIKDYAGNDKYELSNGARIDLSDLSGNDTYISKSTGNTTYFDICDEKGNDKYNLNNSYIGIYDIAGNDKYNIVNSNISSFYDDDGNDTYTFVSATGKVYDYKGKDTYKLTSCNDLFIMDYEGNNKYTAKDSTEVQISVAAEGNNNFTITDSASVGIYAYEDGNDTYKIKNVKGFDSWDEKDGNDTYKITSCSNKGYDHIKFYVEDDAGNEKYTLNAVDNMYFEDHDGNDKYTIKSSDKLDITDDKGNDTYNINKSDNLLIYDYNGDDTYTFNSSNGTVIYDSSGKDTYKMKSLDNTYILDTDGDNTYNLSNCKNSGISGGGTSDSYTINKSQNILIENNSTTSNNTYKVDNLKSSVSIADKGGNDSLTISSLSKKNAILLANFTKNGDGKVQDGDLIILDKKQSGYVIANNYFSTQGSYLSGLDGEGYIETLKAGKANISQAVADRYTDETYIDDLSSVVSGWLSTNTSFDNVEDLMLSDNTAKIKEFVTFVGNYSDNPAAYFA